MKAYGAVAYISDGTHSSFVMTKARVAPLKGHILPRLELLAALTGSRLCKFILSSLDDFQVNIVMWSDSQITLCWLSSKKKLKPFVANNANRVNEIHELLPNATWEYIHTHNNPADLVTRGISFASLSDSQLWQYGPTWLTCKSQWPTWEHAETLHLQTDKEVIEEPTRVDSVPHVTKIYPQSWTLIVSAPYRRYLECQLTYYALFITVSSLIEISDPLVSSSQLILMRYFKPGSVVLNEFQFLWNFLLFNNPLRTAASC